MVSVQLLAELLKLVTETIAYKTVGTGRIHLIEEAIKIR